jgi:hypothetical protein
MKNYEFIKNQKDNNNLIHEDFIYNKDNRQKIINQWRCVVRTCQSVGILQNDDTFERQSMHNHPNFGSKINKMKALVQIKESVNRNSGNNLNIVTGITKKFDEEVLRIMPKFKSMIDNCNRLKNKNLGFNKVNFDDIPDFLKNDLTNETFLQYDSGVVDNDRFIIFFSTRNKKIFCESKIVLVDGTFWSVPRGFKQLITLNFYLFGKYFPLIFILMRSKREEDYKRAFCKIVELINPRFEHLIVDFEIGLKNACENVFEHASIY